MNDTAHELQRKIDAREAVVGVIGLGYVGLPLALCFAEKGFRVLGFDVDAKKKESIEAGDCYIKHIDGERLRSTVRNGRFSASTDFSRLDEADAVLICVPTPLTAEREPQMRYVKASTEEVARRLRAGQLVVLESTTYPGTTGELMKPLLESGSETPLECGRDFFLAFSPEREDPGNREFGTTNTPKVVGGVDRVSGDLAEALYAGIIDEVVRVSSAETAEAAKLTENIFRAVNIALVNELKVVFESMGVDIWEVLDAAATKPFGYMRFDPGPGWGGHCIPLDPFYLAWKARSHGVPTKFIELAGEVNVEMPRYVVDRLAGALETAGKNIEGAKVLVLGLAYKRDIDDPRESPSFEIIDILIGRGAEVRYHDPHIPVAPSMRSWPDLPAMESAPLTPAELEGSDGVVLVTDHSAVDYDMVLDHAPLIVDTRGVFRGRNSKVVKA